MRGKGGTEKGRWYKTVERGKGEGKRGGKKEDVETGEMGGGIGGEEEGLGQQAEGVVEGGGKIDRWDNKRGMWKRSEDNG